MNPSRILLGVNIDHIATLRQARGTVYPDPVYAAAIAEQAGADGITVHLREDRRHIQDRDIRLLAQTLQSRMNFEMAVTEEMLALAEEIKPAHACFVPEKREELTTEGGLDVMGNEPLIAAACERLARSGVEVSLFIDPDRDQIDAAVRCRAPVIELHTGAFAETEGEAQLSELARIKEAAAYAHGLGLVVNAGHGLHYQNVELIAEIPEMNELNIGHAIIARSLFTGLEAAVREMRDLMMAAAARVEGQRIRVRQ